MTEEIKEILDYIDERIIPNEKWNKIKDYITKLQQDLDKANDIIEKDRQFYKCRMDEYVELKKENEKLKFENGNLKTNEQINMEVHNKQLEIIKDYKQRNEKAIKYIKSTNCYGMRSGKTLLQKYLYELLNILQGSDEND